jgi:hypothetical protein
MASQRRVGVAIGFLRHPRFSGTKRPDPLGQRAGHRAGAYSILTGIAANKSIAKGEMVDVAGLVKGLV